ncbi:IclR family transcriptional regulator [uncultured Mailhella sp.]|uniref:IclR family transcriptional regulator n=1 Tax=uncultured Mailhella sp. TaxID=1981031 RepID=UPI0025E24B9A|nr:IclR family transcriptional regulator [uncultured Mailhella sp.]
MPTNISTSSDVHMPTMRVIALLKALSESPQGLTLTQLARTIGSSKGTIFPILDTLLRYEFVRRDPRSNQYELGRGLYMFSEAFRSQDPLMSKAQSCMRDVVDACNEICQLGVLSGPEVLYIAKVNCKEPIQIISRVGSRMPANRTALGKALLSQWSLEDLHRLFQEKLVSSPFDLDAFYRELQQVREKGIAMDIGEIIADLHCLSVPVHFEGRVDCAMSVSLPSFRDTPEKRAIVSLALKNAAAKLEGFMRESQECFSS